MGAVNAAGRALCGRARGAAEAAAVQGSAPVRPVKRPYGAAQQRDIFLRRSGPNAPFDESFCPRNKLKGKNSI